MSKTKGKSFRKEALEATLKKRKECSTKALEVVEKLIEKSVSKATLLENVHFINQSSYQDVIDERSIMNICGYPICCNELRNIPKHQFKITRTNGTLQLFDTTERKKFCCNICFKASKYLRDQLPSCPLWLIEPKDTEYFKLMPLDLKIGGSLGEQINFALKCFSETDQFQQYSLSSRELEIDNVHHENKDNVDNVLLSNCDKILCEKSDEDDDNDSEVFKDAISINSRAENEQMCGNGDDCSVTNPDDIGASSKVEENKLTSDISIIDGCESVNKMNSSSITEYVLRIDNNTTTKEGKSTASSVLCDQHYDTYENKIADSICSDLNKKEHFMNITVKESNYPVMQINDEKSIVEFRTNRLSEKIAMDEKNRIKKEKMAKPKQKVTNDISPMLAAVLRTEQCIREWVSLDTLFFLLGEVKLRNIIEETCGLDKFPGTPQSSMQDPIIYERYVDICKKLNLLELNESKFDRSVKDENGKIIVGPKKPVPDLEKLKKESKEMEIKVKAFYRGDKQVQFNEISEKDDKIGRETVNIPLVDQHAQRALRRRIILDNLNRVLPDLLRALGLSRHYITVNSNVKRLVETFTLSAHNITFRPAEWNFVAIIIIKLLSVCDEVLQQTLLMEKADKYLTLMLMSYEQDSGYLNRLLTWLLYEHTLFNV